MTAVARPRPRQPSDPPLTSAEARGGLAETAKVALPWMTVAATLVVALCWTGTPPGQVVAYGLYWCLCLGLPGTLVHRALRGSRGNLPEDVGFGAVTGLLLEAGAWALAAATGQQHLLWAWPVPVVIAFIAVPGLRRHWRVSYRAPLPLRWSWSVALVMIGTIGWAVARQWALAPLPPVTHEYYVDFYYFLSFVQELTRSMPFQSPQLAGEALHYHFLSYAHMASASMITGVDPATVMLRLWLGPILLASVLVIAAVGRQLVARWWTGPLAAGLSLLGAPIALGGPVPASGVAPISVDSASITFLLPMLTLALSVAVDLVRGRRLGAGWWLFAAVTVGCAGAKASGMPLLAAGLVVAGGAVFLTTRRVPRQLLAGIGLVVVTMAVGVVVFVGAGAGSLNPQLFGFARIWPVFQSTFHIGPPVIVGGLLPPGVSASSVRDWALLFGLLGLWLMAQAPRLAGLLGLSRRAMRRDPAAWLLAGGTVAGVVVMWTTFHPAAAQGYFMVAAIPWGVLLTVWCLADTLPVRPKWTVLAGLAGGFAVSIAMYGLLRSARASTTALAWLALVMVAFAAWWVVVAWVAGARPAARARGQGWRSGLDRGLGLRARGPGLLLSATLGASLAGGWIGVQPVVARLLHGELPAAPVVGPAAVTAAEMRAALWLDAHAADDDVVATNVHCRPVLTVAHCDARGLWVTGLGGHRAVIESWGYTEESMAAAGQGGYRFSRQPPPDADRFALNERVFADPSAAGVRELQQRYGVRWLVADSRAGAVSPRLTDFATRRYQDGTVAIFELPRA